MALSTWRVRYTQGSRLASRQPRSTGEPKPCGPTPHPGRRCHPRWARSIVFMFWEIWLFSLIFPGEAATLKNEKHDQTQNFRLFKDTVVKKYKTKIPTFCVCPFCSCRRLFNFIARFWPRLIIVFILFRSFCYFCRLCNILKNKIDSAYFWLDQNKNVLNKGWNNILSIPNWNKWKLKIFSTWLIQLQR